jgi:glycerophosphoryl diester phosphodiesterase
LTNIIAHRGFSSSYPENTALSFEKAIELGVECVEFDVHLTRDGQLVVIHDAAVHRTTDGNGLVADLTLAEIKGLDAGAWFASGFAGQKILTLAETFDLIGDRARMNVQLKADDSSREELTHKSVDELVRHKILYHAYIASEQETVELVKKIDQRVDICNLSVFPTEDYIARSAAINCRILQPRNRQVDADFVNEARRHGMEVNPFFANDEPEMRRLIACGVDGILTDCPDVLVGVIMSSFH